MAHNPADVFNVLKTGELQQGCSLLVAPRVQTKTMRVQSNKTKPIPGRQSALSLSQFIDQPKRCCNIKNPNKNRTQSRLGRRSSPSSREPHLPLIWTALSFPWFFKEGVTVSVCSWAQKQIYSGQNNHLSWSENGGCPKLWPCTNRKELSSAMEHASKLLSQHGGRTISPPHF